MECVGDVRCWACGGVIVIPKYQITERVRSFGAPSGTQSTPIHKKCFNENEHEYGQYFINGLEEI